MQQLPNNDISGFSKEKKQGIAVSVTIHILLAIFLVTASFKIKPAMPVEVEEGLLVNFGFDQTGEGLFEPAPQEQHTPPPPPAQTRGTDQDVLTQDFEEAPEVKKPEPTAEEIRRQEEAVAERRRIEQENAERLRQEEEQRRLNEINNRTRNAFGNAGNTGESGTSEGIAGGEGNQGVETGTPGVRNYGPGGGTGNGTISYILGDRRFQSLPVPKYDYQGEGIVVVEIAVDRNGTVTQANPGVKGSTTLDEYLLKVAKEAAMKAKFDANSNAPLLQKGFIYYNFKLK